MHNKTNKRRTNLRWVDVCARWSVYLSTKYAFLQSRRRVVCCARRKAVYFCYSFRSFYYSRPHYGRPCRIRGAAQTLAHTHTHQNEAVDSFTGQRTHKRANQANNNYAANANMCACRRTTCGLSLLAQAFTYADAW